MNHTNQHEQAKIYHGETMISIDGKSGTLVWRGRRAGGRLFRVVRKLGKPGEPRHGVSRSTHGAHGEIETVSVTLLP